MSSTKAAHRYISNPELYRRFANFCRCAIGQPVQEQEPPEVQELINSLWASNLEQLNQLSKTIQTKP